LLSQLNCKQLTHEYLDIARRCVDHASRTANGRGIRLCVDEDRPLSVADALLACVGAEVAPPGVLGFEDKRWAKEADQ
jgi:hypothetical protein